MSPDAKLHVLLIKSMSSSELSFKVASFEFRVLTDTRSIPSDLMIRFLSFGSLASVISVNVARIKLRFLFLAISTFCDKSDTNSGLTIFLT